MVSDLKVIHHDECQLLDWGESRATGPWVKLRLADVEYLDAFRGLDTATAKKTGHIFNVTITQGDIITDKSDDWPGDIVNTNGAAADTVMETYSKYGQQAKELRLSSFFRRPDVWRAVGTGLDYAAWVRNHKCSVCGKRDLVESTGEMKCEAAHVRRSGESGTAYKADYAEIPLCRNDHSLQHQHGESAIYEAAGFAPAMTANDTADLAKEWVNKLRIDHVQKWCWETLKTKLGYDSWSKVPPGELLRWAELNNVSGDNNMYLPRCYYDDHSS